MADKQLQLIRELRANSRVKVNSLAQQINVPKSTLFDLLYRLERDKVVQHTTLVDFKKLGYHVRILAALKVMSSERKKVLEYLQASGHVNNLFVINSGYDFLTELVFKDQKVAYDFLKKIDEQFTIINRNEFLIIDEVCREVFLRGATPEITPD